MVSLGLCLPAVFGETSPAAVERAADVGADAVEFFDWPEQDLDALAAAADDHGVDVAAITGPTGSPLAEPSLTDPAHRDAAVASLTEDVAAAARVGAHAVIVTVGPDYDRLDDATMHESVVAGLREVAPVAEDAGVELLVEPLNVAVDHPGYYLVSSREGFDVVAAVDSPNVSLLFDLYHQQISEGNLLATVTANIEHVGHFHAADVPGRHEPGTGELHYENIVTTIAETGFDGYLTMELSPTVAPEAAFEDVVGWFDAL